MDIATILGVYLPGAIDRLSQAIQYPPLQAVPDRDIERHPDRKNVRTGSDTLNLPKGHQQHPIAPEADDLRPERIRLRIAQNTKLT
jgi:hypothetical protein